MYVNVHFVLYPLEQIRIQFLWFRFHLAFLDECPEKLLSDRYIKFDAVHLISAKDEIAIDGVIKSIRATLDKHAELALEENLENNRKNNRENVSRFRHKDQWAKIKLEF